jgi:glycogen(starch) synthase
VPTMRALRILTIGTLYPPHSIGGYEMNWRDIVAHLRGRGHDVRVLCGDWREADNGEPEDSDTHRELQLQVDGLLDVVPISRAAVIAREQANTATVALHLEAFAPDIAVLGPMGGLSIGIARQLRLAGIPQLAFVFDDWTDYYLKADAWQRRLQRRGPLAARLAQRHGLPGRFAPADIDSWVIISERTRRKALAAGVPVERTSLLAPGPDDARFAPVPAQPWRGELLYSGRLHPDKGLEHLIRALPALPDMRLTVKGGGDPRHLAKLQGIVAEVGVQDRIVFLGGGGFDKVPELYAACDAVVFPSVWDEPWGLVPLEAMAVGRPVVASGVGGTREYLEDERNALVVPPADPAAIAAALQRLADEPALRERLREGGTATAARYRYADFLDEMCDRIEAVAAAPA